MSKSLGYKIFVYLFTFLVIIGGGILYAVLQTKSATDAENSSTSVYAEDVYGSGVHYIHPSQDEISLWDGVSSEAPEGMGTQNSPYLIASAANLKYFQQNYSTFNSTYLLQTVNIDLQNNPWTPISSGTYYYDGGGHTIYNLYIERQEERAVGFFMGIESDSYVRNLNFIGVSIFVNVTTLTSGYSRVGVVNAECSCTSGSTIKNVHVKNAIINVKTSTNACEVGGIHAGAEYLVDDGNTFDGNIYVTSIATNSGRYLVGGICGGFNKNAQFLNCTSFGNVVVDTSSADSALEVGGICGGDYSNGSGYLVENCVNYANVQAKGRKRVHASGIAGVLAYSPQANVSKCINYGNIYATSSFTNANVATRAAGISGIGLNVNFSQCLNYGNIYCENTGTGDTQTGGIVGWLETGTMSNCLSAGNVLGRESGTRDAEVGGLCGRFLGSSTVTSTIDHCLSTGTVAVYNGNINALGGSFGYVYNDSVSISYVYHVTDVITNGHWETAYYMSNTSKITGLGDGNLYNGHGPTTASISSLDGQHVVMPTTVGGVSINCTSSGGITSANAKVTTVNSAPTGLTGFSTDYWDFSQVGEYPKLKNMPTGTNLKAETKQIKLVTTNTSKIYDGTEQEQQAEVCTYELKGFENSDPTSYWDGITTTMPNGKGTQADPYLIESAANLAWVSENSQTATGLALNKYYTQVVNIDLNNMFWTPIGPNNSTGSNIYYDGNYHTISNLYIYRTTGYVALFARLKEGSYIKNLGIESGKIVAVNSSFVGAICGDVLKGYVLNCYNKAAIFSENTNHIGGICAYCGGDYGFGSYIQNCWNAGNIYASSFARCGGVIGGGTAVNCVNTGKIILKAHRDENTGAVGGVVGWGKSDYSINYGDIIASGEGRISGCFIGGLVGICIVSNVNESYNYGSLAGLLGYCSHVGALTGSVVAASSHLIYAYYNKEMIGFNVTNSIYSENDKTTLLTDTTGALSTKDLVVTAENTKPTGVAASNNFNYFKGAFPSVKSKIGNMTFYQKVIDENGVKPEISCWNGSYDTNYVVAPTLLNSGAENSEANPYIIDSAAKLAYLCKYSNTSAMHGKYFKQTVDIDLCGYNWSPISPGDYIYHYEGDNHTIYNLYIYKNTSDLIFAGFFGKIRAGSYIKNLTINGGYIEVIQTGATHNIVGAFVGQVQNTGTADCDLINCHAINVNIKAIKTTDSAGWDRIYCGGIVGSITTDATNGFVNIKNCSNTGDIYAENYVSSFIYVGGIVGVGSIKSCVEKCVNYGNVTAKTRGWAMVGGIAGWWGSTGSTSTKLSNCSNYGDVYGSTINNECCAGGIVGYLETGYAESDAHVSYCFNAGNVRGEETSAKSPAVGGIVGGSYGSSAENSAKILKCFSVGSVATLNGNSVNYLGGVLGWFRGEYTTITNCYYNYETVNQGFWTDNVVYLSNAADSQYLWGSISEKINGGDGTITNSWPRSTDAMKSSADGVAPSGINNISNNDTIYSLVAGRYPRIKSIPEENYSYNLNGLKSKVNTNSVQEISVWDGTSTAPSLLYSGAPNSESNPYIIDSAQKLAWMSVNDSSANNCYFRQTVDIDLDNRLWTPINTRGGTYYYYYYDGQNHTIFNINVNQSSSSAHVFSGLFGRLSGCVKNIKMQNGSIVATETATNQIAHAGAIAGCPALGAVIDNCSVDNFNITLTSTKYFGHIGGIGGNIYGGSIYNCVVTNTSISATTRENYCHVGGIAGQLYHTGGVIENCVSYANIIVYSGTNHSVGGIVGNLETAGASKIISNCVNYGTIVTHRYKNQTHNGGIVGYTAEGSSIIDCVNYGSVTTYAHSSDSGSTPVVGGILGRAQAGSNIFVTGCVNYGEVYLEAEDGVVSQLDAGGICAVARGLEINSCVNYGSISIYNNSAGWQVVGGICANFAIDNNGIIDKVLNSFNAGSVMSNRSTSCRLGGIIGTGPLTADNISNSIVTNCYFDTNKVSSSAAQWSGNVVYASQVFGAGNYTQTSVSGLTTAQMQGLTTSMTGFSSDIWEFHADDYPTLKSLSQSVSVWDGSASVKPVGAGTNTNPYIIASAANLNYLSVHYNDNDIKGKYFKQVVDIDLDNHEWTPINSSGNGNSYYYDGNNHTIYNLTMSGTNGWKGLFLHITAGSYIKNLTIERALITPSPTVSYQYLGTFVATTGGSADNRVVLENLHAVGVKFNITTTSVPRVGGIVGQTYYTTVKNCSFSGDISYMSTAASGTGGLGGIGGWAHYTDSSAGTGYTVIENCINDANIYYSGNGVCGGGIFGWIQKEEITNCVNNGNIFGTAGANYANIGGIVGTGQPTITNCVNTGNILVQNGYAGGIAGSGGPTITYSYSVGSCGAITAGKVGGIIGNTSSASSCYSYYNSDNIVNNFGQTVAVLATGVYGQGGGSSTTCAPLTTSQMIVISDGTAPSGMTGFTTDNWVFLTGGYPQIKGLKIESNKISYWDGSSSEAPTKGDGSAGNPYQIASAANLKWMRDNSTICSQRYFVQTVDIDLCNHDWTPINYGCKYDGQNHTIYNLYCQGEQDVIVGLFGRFEGEGIYLKNLTVDGVNLSSTATVNSHIAVLAGLTGSSSSSFMVIDNCHVMNGTLTTTSTASADYTQNAGAITSYSSNGSKLKISNCSSKNINYVFGGVRATVVGGMIGRAVANVIVENCVNYSDVKIENNVQNTSFIGGMVGYADSTTTIRNCVNYGQIYAYNTTTTLEMGGLLGYNAGIQSYIDNSKNYGEVKLYKGTSTSAAANIGGLVGRCVRGEDYLTITNVVNYGDVFIDAPSATGTEGYAGGIGGLAYGLKLVNAINYGNVYMRIASGVNNIRIGGIIAGSGSTSYLKIQNVFNSGRVVSSINTGSKYVGGLVGWYNTNIIKCVLENCYYDSSVMSNSSAPWGVGWCAYDIVGEGMKNDFVTNRNPINVSGLTTAQMTSSANGTRPTGMVGFTQENWNFVKGAYPSLGLMAYEKIYSDNINAGTASVSVALGKNSGYSGVLTSSYTISQATNVFTISPTFADFTYLGTVSTPIAAARFGEVTYFFRDTAMTWNSNTISNTWNAGSYCIVFRVAGTDNYTGLQTTLTFHINPIDLTDNANLHIDLDQTEYVYDGNAHTPTETVTYG